MNRYTETFTVRGYETRSDNRLRVATLLHYLEHAAGEHAEQLGCSVQALGDTGITWVLARMSLSFHAFPRQGETLVLETWPSGVERLLFRRHYRVRNRAGDLIVSGVSWWVVFGLRSRKIEPVPDFLKERLAVCSQQPMERADVRIPALRAPSQGPGFRARLSDIDRNGHVNNGRFVDFVLEDAFRRGRTEDGLRGLEIIYRGEAFLDDALQVSGEVGIDNSLLHSVRRSDDGQELVRARTIWALE